MKYMYKKKKRRRRSPRVGAPRALGREAHRRAVGAARARARVEGATRVPREAHEERPVRAVIVLGVGLEEVRDRGADLRVVDGPARRGRDAEEAREEALLLGVVEARARAREEEDLGEATLEGGGEGGGG